MDQRLSLVTLGVADLPRAREFYEALGWRGQEVEQTVFFQAGDMAIVLWDKAKLAQDCGLPDRSEGSFDGIALAQNLRSRADVDELVAAAAQAGAAVTKPAAETFYGGYAGVFTDPDGHAWEVAHNPGIRFEEDGSLTLPDFGSATG